VPFSVPFGHLVIKGRVLCAAKPVLIDMIYYKISVEMQLDIVIVLNTIVNAVTKHGLNCITNIRTKPVRYMYKFEINRMDIKLVLFRVRVPYGMQGLK
jgi:hypothetical protein